MKKILENIERVVAFLSKDNKPYICGEEAGFTDYMVWPHLERMSVMKLGVLKDQPVLQAYCERMEKNPAVKACRHSDDLHMQFIQSFQGGNTTYDIGTVTDY